MNIRFIALKETFSRRPKAVDSVPKRSEIFEENVFTDERMREYLDEQAYRAFLEAKHKGYGIDRALADRIAAAMKQWAISKGATHYTHWFQPLTGATAEKHDSFLEKLPDGKAIERFTGDQLVQQEPDASSFPSGGLRNTFEARGYTAWDPGSPAFIMGTTLCIPTVFISYNGEALDYKTPLIRSIQFLDKYATETARLFNRDVERVYATLGWEQEYFLVDKALYTSRPDLIMTGRTLLGHAPAKNQQLDDHYFGSIPERVMAFMRDLEIEALKIGIPVKTRHNEVAPNQYEVAPVFEEVNLAVDHNSMMMDLMKKVARRHDFEVLLHEKPFAYINGSGKHNNWSLMTDTGINLLSPGNTPKRNLRFLTFFVNVIKAVNDYEELLRASIASPGNDHRLGANEAPPAIISVFIGHYLTGVMQELKQVTNGKLSPDEKTGLKLEVVGKIPEILRDNTDRNRTSPFAFTGNKFEIRAVGSSANCASPMTILNTIVGHQLKQFLADYRALRDQGLKKDEAIFNILRDYIRQSERILFEGNGYSPEWHAEAARRGLSNLKTTPEALRVIKQERIIRLFEESGVYSRAELESRYQVHLEQYNTKLEIEARVLADLVSNHVEPTVVHYQERLAANLERLKSLFPRNKKMWARNEETLRRLNTAYADLASANALLKEAVARLETMEDEDAKADYITGTVKDLMDRVRAHADRLELMVDDALWPLTKYREMLFTR
ncbi:MAG: glutamine synthetase type III [Chlorobi bacterium]|nr:glutamine synthetase type III [Chlorobiota bacterium]